MIKLFKRNEPTPDPTIALQNQITELERKHHILHSEITSEPNLIKKKQLQQEEARLLQKISTLKQQKQPYDEAKASQKIDALFRDQQRTVIYTVNGHRIKPDKHLNITLTFRPCGHKKQIHVKHLLSYQHSIGVPATEQALLSKWQSIFTTSTSLTTGFLCEECRKAKRKKLTQDRISSDKDIIGTCAVAMQIL